MIVGLLAVVAAVGHGADLGGSVFLEASGNDGVQLLVLPPVSHHLVGVGAIIVTLEAMEVTRTLGWLPWHSS